MNENIQKVVLTADNRTKSAFATFRKDVRNSDDAVSKLQKTSAVLRSGMAGLGITLSGVAFTGMIKGVADAQDSLAKMSQQTGIAVETLAGLEFAAGQSGTSLERTGKAVKNFSKIILEADGGTDKYSKLIKALGLDLEALKNATPEDQFISLAGAIRNNVAEQERGAVVTALLGERYTELIPLLSQGEQGLREMIAQGQRLNPVTAESAANAEIFNDNLDKLQRSFGTIKVQAANSILPALVSITTEMERATEQSGILAGVLAGLDNILTRIAKSSSFGQGILGPLGYLLAQKEEANEVAQALGEVSDEADKAAESVSGIVIPGVKPSAPRSFQKVLDEINAKSKQAAASVKTMSTALSEEEKQAQETAREIERLTLKFDPLIAFNKEFSDLIRLRSNGLADSIYSAAVEDALGRYSAATQEVSSGIEDIDIQTQQLQATTEQMFDSSTQIAISGVRGIQNAFADGLFNFFDDGLAGMVRSVKSAVGRIAAEFASIKLLQSTGLVGALGLGSGSAFAAGGGGGAGLFDIASLGAGSANLINSGFGTSSLFSSLASSGIGQSLGLSVVGPVPGFGQLTSLGSGLSTGLGALGAGGVGVGIGSLLAGNRTIGGVNGTLSSTGGAALGAAIGSVVPGIGTAIGALGGGIIGGVINDIFGRGPLEREETNLIGDFTADGFSGVTSAKFKAEGGLARGDKVDRIITDTDSGELLNEFRGLREGGISKSLRPVADDEREAALQLGSFLDESVKGISVALRDAADNLGLGTDAIDGFSSSINIASEKGESLTDLQIGEEIANVADQMATALIPEIDSLKESGETASQAVSRFNSQFKTLQDGLELVGVESEVARNFLQGFSIEQRSAFIDQVGGIEQFTAGIAGLFDGLDDSFKLEVLKTRLTEALDVVGVGFIPTMEQFNAAMLSGKLSVDQLALGLDPLFQGILGQFNDLKVSLKETGDIAGDDAAASMTVLNESLNQIAFGSVREAADALSELSDVADEYKDRALAAIAAERNAFTAARREQQSGNAPAPTIATTINGRIFTEEEIREQQKSALDGAFDKAKSVVEEQIKRLDESMRNARDMIRDQISGVRESVSFFSKFKEDALDISNSSFAASKAQLDASISLARAGAELNQIDTPELTKAIGALKQDRSDFFSSRKAFELDKAQTSSKIDELSLIGTSRADQTINILTDQLEVLQDTYDLESNRLNGTLDFINFQGGRGSAADPSVLSDDGLQSAFESSIQSLNQAERIRRNTSFNGSVQYPFTPGTNESADAQDAARLRRLNTFAAQSQAGGSDIASDLKAELAELRKQVTESKEASRSLFNLFNSMTDDGRSLNVVTSS